MLAVARRPSLRKHGVLFGVLIAGVFLLTRRADCSQGDDWSCGALLLISATWHIKYELDRQSAGSAEGL